MGKTRHAEFENLVCDTSECISHCRVCLQNLILIFPRFEKRSWWGAGHRSAFCLRSPPRATRAPAPSIAGLPVRSATEHLSLTGPWTTDPSFASSTNHEVWRASPCCGGKAGLPGVPIIIGQAPEGRGDRGPLCGPGGVSGRPIPSWSFQGPSSPISVRSSGKALGWAWGPTFQVPICAALTMGAAKGRPLPIVRL